MLDPICERHVAIDRLAERDFGRLGLSRTRAAARSPKAILEKPNRPKKTSLHAFDGGF
jgi:hypothetical protein